MYLDRCRGILAHLIITLFKNDEKKCNLMGSCSLLKVAI